MGQRQNKARASYFRQIDFIFYSEKALRDSVISARLGNEVVGFRIAGGNNLTDPTATKALKNLTPLNSVLVNGRLVKFPESWLLVIDKTYEWSKRHKDCRYEIARRRYSGEDYRQTCLELNVSNSTRRRLFELVQIYAALQAVQLGLIRI